MSQTIDAASSARTRHDREALRAELEATRHAFHALVDSLSEEQWRQKSPSTRWTTREVLVHLTWSLNYLPKEVESARRGKGMFNYPKRIADPASYWLTRWSARNATPAHVKQHFDHAMDAVLDALDSVKDAEWDLGARFYGEGYYTIEGLFHTPAQHFAAHTAGMATAP